MLNILRCASSHSWSEVEVHIGPIVLRQCNTIDNNIGLHDFRHIDETLRTHEDLELQGRSRTRMGINRPTHWEQWGVGTVDWIPHRSWTHLGALYKFIPIWIRPLYLIHEHISTDTTEVSPTIRLVSDCRSHPEKCMWTLTLAAGARYHNYSSKCHIRPLSSNYLIWLVRVNGYP